jgi:hypothetical protein
LVSHEEIGLLHFSANEIALNLFDHSVGAVTAALRHQATIPGEAIRRSDEKGADVVLLGSHIAV